MINFIVRQTAFYQQLLHRTLPPRPRSTHKGMFGHLVVIGGGVGMAGAVYLAAKAALRVGAGLVTVVTRPEHADKALSFLPEAMVYGVQNASDLAPLLAKATACILGPGLGETPWAMELYDKTLATSLPLIVDASALRLLSMHKQTRPHWILTPHPGEAASLLGIQSDEIQANRNQAAIQLQQQYHGVVVLKGCQTVVNFGDEDGDICAAGNPGMSSPGMGDVLSGLLGGLVAQGVSLKNAARLGVWLHAHAADLAANVDGEIGLLAHDLLPYVRRLINSKYYDAG